LVASPGRAGPPWAHGARNCQTGGRQKQRAARGLADREPRPIGAAISARARQALQKPATPAGMRHGVPLPPLLLQPGATPVTLEHVNRLRDEPA
jgi:hypothetical protein